MSLCQTLGNIWKVVLTFDISLGENISDGADHDENDFGGGVDASGDQIFQSVNNNVISVLFTLVLDLTFFFAY